MRQRAGNSMPLIEPSSTPAVTGLIAGVAHESSDLDRVDVELRAAIRDLARTTHLLVACDYDGTLSPIVADPTQARPLPGAAALLRRLAELPATTVAVISGRALRDLAAMSRLPIEIELVGSHGAEFDLSAFATLDQTRTALLAKVRAACQEAIAPVRGTQLEIKPASVTVHVRGAEAGEGRQVLMQLADTVAHWPDIHTTHGKMIIEFSVVAADKGAALQKLRADNSATAALFIGDDVTDETAFARLSVDDVGVKVGPGTSLAGYRVDSPEAVLSLLETITGERQAWLAGADTEPIEDHTLLSDGTDVALLTPSGSVSWMCFPGPDAPAVFAGLLGDPEAGHLTVRPIRDRRLLSQSYLEGTLTVLTRWAGVTVTDYLDVSNDRGSVHDAPARLVRHISGRQPVEVIFAPRPQFGSVAARLEVSADGVRVVESSDPLVLVAPGLDWTIVRVGAHQSATAVIDPAKGDFVVELRAGTESMAPDSRPEADRRALTNTYWRSFGAALDLPRQRGAMVLRSALTLKALCHRPTGAAIAAATTSLPEWIGGIRNWDYRYCWLRDAAMTVHALVLLGSTNEADAFLAWLQRVLGNAISADRIHPLYSVAGTTLGPEAVVDTLPGYAGSRPVRIGNAAQGQVQLDVYGPICSLIAATARRRGVTGLDLQIINNCVEAVRRRWREPDHGIWEIRDEPRRHLHSRVMCWQAVDAALAVLALTKSDNAAWRALRDEIAADILTDGYNAEANTFVSAYGRTDVDAGVLSVITSGLLPGDDPRAVGTIRAVEIALRDGPTVYRYRHDDGLPGTEGGMHLCTSWLVEAYAAAGLTEEAQILFDQLVACAGATGLLPEMHDPGAERGLGNHPQAYSHIGLIRAALTLDGPHRIG